MALQDSEPVWLHVKDRNGKDSSIVIGPDEEYNLMEILKSNDFKMRATCGGMGLCADCHCNVNNGIERLPEPTMQELETLDLIPGVSPKSRLACQIQPGQYLHNVYIELLGKDHF